MLKTKINKTYGGGSGVWLSRKSERRTSKQPLLVGWDDVLCRPIYQTTPRIKTSNTKDDLLIDDGCHYLASQQSKDSISRSKVRISTDAWNEDNKRSSKRKRLRSYGFKKNENRHGRLSLDTLEKFTDYWSPAPNKKKFNFHQQTSISKLSLSDSSIKHSVKKDVKDSSNCILTSSRVTSSFLYSNLSSDDALDYFILTPQKSNISVCSILDSNNIKKKKNMIDNGKRSFKKQSTNLKQDFCLSNIKIQSSKGRICEESNQPSSHTAISSAKAFFIKLDSHQLNLNYDKDKSPLVSSRPIRTIQKLNLGDPMLLKDYKLYSRATIDNGLTPIKLKNYAKCRSEFFSSGKFFDGFLAD